MSSLRMIQVCLIAAAFVLASCETTTNVDEIKQIINEANAKQIEGFKTKDIEAMIVNYAPDAVVLPQNSPMVEGRDAIKEFFRGMSALMGDMTFSTVRFDASGDIAYEFGTYEGSFGGVPDKGKYVAVWKKQADGNWMIVADIFNTDLPFPEHTE